jgi:hypothetical protein
MANILSQEEIEALLEIVDDDYNVLMFDEENLLKKIEKSIGILLSKEIEIDKSSFEIQNKLNEIDFNVMEFYIKNNNNEHFIFTFGIDIESLKTFEKIFKENTQEYIAKWLLYSNFEEWIIIDNNDFSKFKSIINQYLLKNKDNYDLLNTILKKLNADILFKEYKLKNMIFSKDNEHFNPYQTNVIFEVFSKFNIEQLTQPTIWIKFEQLNVIDSKKLKLIKKSKILLDCSDFLDL